MKRKSILTMIILLFIVITYRTFYKIDINTYEIESDKISKEIKIVLIGDSHDDTFHQERIIKHIQEMQPDLILCTGDMLDEDSKNTVEFLNTLNDIADVYMSLGNHEYTSGLLSELYKGNFTILDEENVDVEVNDNRLRIGSMFNYAFSQVDGKITEESMHNSSTYQFLSDMTNSDTFKIMLAHRPDSFIYCDAYKWDIDLVVSGHTHGGQVVLPIIGGIFAPEQGWFPKYDYGCFDLNGMKMIITKGIGNNIPFPRINNPSELVEVVVK